ncbi:MAG TPA: F0F1 ATP synthase subunit A, partial [Gemmataceae bacterium]|nr:F0F1 ATP synthase subunit A [Gemmataceae bacterium]
MNRRASGVAERNGGRPGFRGGLAGALLVTLLATTGPAQAVRGAAGGDPQPAKPADKSARKSAPAKKHSAIEHVMDNKDEWEFVESFGLKLRLPRIFGRPITKFMLVEVIAAILVVVMYVPLARRLQSGAPPKGWRDNAREVLLTFIRDEVAKPSIGEHDADRYVPFLWTLFLFILFCNLLGLIPFGASPTASIYVTGALAVCVFFAIHGSAVAKMGLIPYVKSQWPHMDVPFPLGYFLKPMVFGIEIIGTLVRNAVLAVRLFANMFAGHMVLATILLFMTVAVQPLLWVSITATSIAGVVALSLLEIFVALLQA